MRVTYSPQKETVIVKVFKSYEEVVQHILEQEQENAETYVNFIREGS